MKDAANVDMLQQLATFVRIADAGSISAAARSLRLSVPMASRQLRALEDELGVTLMLRTTRQLALTDAGSELLVRARGLLSAVGEMREVVQPGRVAGLVVMSLPVSFGLAQIGPLFPALLRAHPHLKLELRFEDRFVDLLGDGVDIAVRAGAPPPDSPFVMARPLAIIDRVICASPAFLRQHGHPRSIAALATMPCVVQGAAPAQWSFDTAAGPEVVTIDGRMRTNNVLGLRDAAVAGLGIARLPRWIAEAELKSKQLVPVLPSVSLPTLTVFGVFHRAARSSVAVRTVLDFVRSELPRRTSMRAP